MGEDKRGYRADYSQLKTKLFFELAGMVTAATAIIFFLYKVVWSHRGADWMVNIFQKYLLLDYDKALELYWRLFRGNMEFIWLFAIIAMFLLLLRIVLNLFTGYFDIVSQGIDALLKEDAEIRLPSEMLALERKLNSVKQALEQRTVQARQAEQRKNDLVMYLAHDIRTPLTSIIGYLNLIEEAPDMPAEQKAKYVHITLDKAYRLEKMVNEFFEITRYNLQQITLSKENIDLYYMLVQLTDELSPVLAENGNTVMLKADENLKVCGDPDKLARVFNNVLKNAAAYSYPNTEIVIDAEDKGGFIVITFRNKGNPIPEEKLATIFERFYRLDEARISNTGGAGLGLAIAKEIVSLHGGTIAAKSEEFMVSFIIALPAGNGAERRGDEAHGPVS